MNRYIPSLLSAALVFTLCFSLVVEAGPVRGGKKKSKKKPLVPQVEQFQALEKPADRDSYLVDVMTVETELQIGSVIGHINGPGGKKEITWKKNVYYTDVIEAVRNLLTDLQYHTPGVNPRNQLEESIKDAEMVLSGKITDMRTEYRYATDFWSGELKLKEDASWVKVTWSLYDTLNRETVWEMETEASAGGKDLTSLFSAIIGSAKNFLASSDTQAHLCANREELVSSAESVDPLALKGANVGLFKGHMKLEEVTESVVIVRSGLGHGSGFVIGEGGYILTNQHVIGSGDRVKVVLNDGRELDGLVLRRNVERDVALVKVTGENLPKPLVVKQDLPGLGNTVFAVGTPVSEEYASTVSKGIVSSVRKLDGQNFIQSDVNIYGGNSGGPLVDEDGRVVGITVSQIRSEGGGVVGLNFFIPIAEGLEMLNLSL